MTFIMRVTILLFFSMFCMVHSTVSKRGSKNIKYDLQDSISLSRSIENNDIRINPSDLNLKQARKKYKNNNKITPNQLSKKLNGASKKRSIRKKGVIKYDNELGKNKVIASKKVHKQVKKISNQKVIQKRVKNTKGIRQTANRNIAPKRKSKPENKPSKGLVCSQKKGECIPKKKPCSGDIFRGKKFCKNQNFVCCVPDSVIKIPSCEGSDGSCVNLKKGCAADEVASTYSCASPKRFKCCMKKTIDIPIVDNPPICETVNGKCIKITKPCRGEVQTGAEYCDYPKRFKCCIKKDEPTKPSVVKSPKCETETVGGSCINMKKPCRGEERTGSEYCQYPKRFKCCIKKTMPNVPTDCSNKPKCLSLNGICIKRNEICNGKEFYDKAYCTSYRTCKCCVEFTQTESLPLTTVNVNPTTFIPTTRPIFSTKKTTEAKPIPTTKQKEFTTTTQPVPTTEDLSCYREMDTGDQVHTMLQTANSECKAYRSGVTEESKIEILKLHNHYRTQIAMGQEQRGAPGPQPPGSNIREIVWNDELAKIAQAWVDQCPKGQDCRDCRSLCSRDYKVGQNAFFYGSNKDEKSWAQAIKKWFDEVSVFDASNVEALTRPIPGKSFIQYTQILWADTYEIGCGAIYFPMEVPLKNGDTMVLKSTRLYICNYGPTGNYLNRPVYKIGEAATDCPSGVSSTYPALCA